ncbi:MAG: FAD-dependent oxidoreductase, partial [Deltaproteobacteria bacterium]|nr:FAD-dependent oxidoreductase [Deltaproteobacteria bacterium]
INLGLAKKIAKGLEDAGVDAISLCSGTYGTPPSLAFGASWPPYQKKGFLTSYAAEIKKVVGIPVIMVGALHFVEIAEQILDENKADFIAIGRGLIADPEIPKKLMENRPEDIRRCIRCNECVAGVVTYVSVSCTLNAAAGREARRQIIQAEKKKRVLIVGGGPGGMEAARIAALRGHDVTLIEKKNRLGGMLNPASVPKFKEELKYLSEWFNTQLNKLGIQLELEKDVTTEIVLEMKPDTVIVATGAIPVIPDLPGDENAVHAIDVLNGDKTVGARVVVVGGGLVGCETALHLAMNGKIVTILEMMDDIILDANLFARAALMEKLTELGVRWKTHVKLDKVKKECAVAIDANGQEHLFPGDTVLALGFVSENKLANSLEGKIKEVYSIGDCVAPRKIRQAIQEGFNIASQI